MRRYHHEDGRWPQAVTGITDEAGVRYGSYAYDAQGRVTRSRRCYGRDQDRDPLLNCNEPGPPTHSCTFIEGSIGKEKEIVSRAASHSLAS